MGNSQVAPRKNVTHQVNYFRATVNFDTLNIGTTAKVPLGTLPSGAIVVTALVKIVTAFNAATTNVLTVGTSADAAAVISATDVNEAATGTTVPAAALGYYVTSDTPLYVKYTQTGTAATTGQAIICLGFIPNNDR